MVILLIYHSLTIKSTTITRCYTGTIFTYMTPDCKQYVNEVTTEHGVIKGHHCRWLNSRPRDLTRHDGSQRNPMLTISVNKVPDNYHIFNIPFRCPTSAETCRGNRLPAKRDPCEPSQGTSRVIQPLVPNGAQM